MIQYCLIVLLSYYIDDTILKVHTDVHIIEPCEFYIYAQQ